QRTLQHHAQSGFVSPVDNAQCLELLRLRSLGDHVHQRADTTSTLKTDAAVEQGDVHMLDAFDRGAIGRQAVNVDIARDAWAYRRRGERESRRNERAAWPRESRPGDDL